MSRMHRFAVALVGLALEATSAYATPKCDKGYSYATLRAVRQVLGADITDLSIWLGRADKSDIDRQRAEIAKLRAWARGLKEECARTGYLGWLEWFDGRLNEAEAELRHGHIRRSQEQFRRENEADFDRARKIEETMPKPPTVTR